MKTNNLVTYGYFIYNQTKQTLSLTNNSNEDILSISIISITDTELKGFLFFTSDPVETIDVTLTIAN